MPVSLEVTLADSRDTYNFTSPMVINYSTGSERVLNAVQRAWKRLTWWRHPRMMVVYIDHEEGRVCLDTQWWSWRRLRWASEDL